MQITDQQFIDAMEQSIAQKGPGHKAEATYTLCGEAECIIGYALNVIGKEFLPTSNSMLAEPMLLSLGASHKVAAAAHAAQYLNDSGFRWGAVLWGFKHAIATHVPGESTNSLIVRVRAKVAEHNALDLAAEPKFTIHPDAVAALTAQMQAFSKSLTDATIASMDQYSYLTKPSLTVSMKKDYALTV